uniref:Ig-like domain-containing protein n=1 Tax=Lates calcarifer TaxID=8187 RepID=A0A4W6FAD8_LATCA
MIGRLAAFILLCTACLIQTTKVSQQISLTVVELGENVTLHCPVAEKDDRSYWYKQSLGHMAQTVAAVIFEKITITEQFKDPRFTVTKKEAQSLLTIRNVSKEDEATYFCQTGTTFSLTSGSGTFLAVNGKISFHIFNIFALSNSLDCDFLNVQLLLHITNRCSSDKKSLSFIIRSNECEAESVNYAALNFSARNTKRVKKTSGSPQECLYSAVQQNRADHHIQHQPSS